jgi:hypothetical protein
LTPVPGFEHLSKEPIRAAHPPGGIVDPRAVVELDALQLAEGRVEADLFGVEQRRLPRNLRLWNLGLQEQIANRVLSDNAYRIPSRWLGASHSRIFLFVL